MSMMAMLCFVLAAVLLTASAHELEDRVGRLENITCQAFLGDIPGCPARSCKHIVDTKLWPSRSGYHWLGDSSAFQAYCTLSISPSESRGWMRVADVSASQGCPSGLEPVTAGGRKMCRKTVDRGCSSVTFPTHGLSYSKVCGWASGYNKGSPDAFQRYTNCPGCTIEKPYVDGISITHAHPRQHIWSLAAATSTTHAHHCPCTSSPNSFTYLPPFVGNDYSCEYERRDTYTTAERLWDGLDCPATDLQCCDGDSWFCKQLPQPTTDDIEFRLCSDESRNNEDVYIEDFHLYVQ